MSKYQVFKAIAAAGFYANVPLACYFAWESAWLAFATAASGAFFSLAAFACWHTRLLEEKGGAA